MAMKGKGVLFVGDQKNEGNFVEKNEMTMRFYEYTCTFCFKKFYCAQAMGGHQNAHRLERIREKNLFVHDPIGCPKQGFIRSVKTLKDSDQSKSNVAAIKFRLLNNLRAAREMVKHETTVSQKKVIKPQPASLESSSRVASIIPQKKLAPLRIKPKPLAAKGNYYHHPCNNQRDSFFSPIQLNSFSPMELSLAVKVGIHAEDAAEAMVCNGTGNEVEAENLDLTLKL